MPARFRVLWWKGPSLNPTVGCDGPFESWLEATAPFGYRLVSVIVHEGPRRECIFESEPKGLAAQRPTSRGRSPRPLPVMRG